MSKFREKSEDGSVYYNFTKNTFGHFENDWKQLFGTYNWKTYRIADIYYEDDVVFGGKEFRFVLFGIGFRIRHNNPNNEKMAKLKEIAENLAKSTNKSKG